MLPNLVAHVAELRQGIFFIPVKRGRIFYIPMEAFARIQECPWTVLVSMAANSDQIVKVDTAEILAHIL